MNLSQFVFCPPVKIPEGCAGVFCVPELGITLPVRQQRNGNGQENIDLEYCGNLTMYGGCKLIEDHAGSKLIPAGVWDMLRVKIGMIGFLVTETTEFKFRAFQITQVHNTGFIYAHKGRAITGFSSKDLFTTSCLDEPGEQVLVAWQYVYQMPRV